MTDSPCSAELFCYDAVSCPCLFLFLPKIFFNNMREQKRKAPDLLFWPGAFLKVRFEKVYTRTTDPTSRGCARRALSLPSANKAPGMLKEDVPLARDDDTGKMFTCPSPSTAALKSVERLFNFLHIEQHIGQFPSRQHFSVKKFYFHNTPQNPRLTV